MSVIAVTCTSAQHIVWLSCFLLWYMGISLQNCSVTSEIRGLHSTKCSIQNFHFVQLYFFPYECPGTPLKWDVFDPWIALEMWHMPLNPILYVDNIATKNFSKAATSAKWQPFPVSLACCWAERQWRGQILELRRVIKTSRMSARCFDDST